MHIHDAETYRDLLEADIRKHASRPVSLRIVDDVRDWDRANGIAGQCNPSAQAATLGGAWCIVLRRELDGSRTKGILDLLLFAGESRLTSPELFLRHLVLHELAHLENSWGQEYELQCDEWASNRLFHR